MLSIRRLRTSAYFLPRSFCALFVVPVNRHERFRKGYLTSLKGSRVTGRPLKKASFHIKWGHLDTVDEFPGWNCSAARSILLLVKSPSFTHAITHPLDDMPCPFRSYLVFLLLVYTRARILCIRFSPLW